VNGADVTFDRENAVRAILGQEIVGHGLSIALILITQGFDLPAPPFGLGRNE
jgi:hypothetical protein